MWTKHELCLWFFSSLHLGSSWEDETSNIALVLSPDGARTVCLTWNKTTPLLAKCGRQNNGPQTYHILIPDLWMICGKKGILQRWLRILSWGDDPGLSRWPNIITRVLTSERGRQRVREDVMTEAEVGVVPASSGGWEPRNAGSFQKLEKERGQILLWGLQTEPALTLVQWDPLVQLVHFGLLISRTIK